MLQAMNTGHDGSLTTLHANTPRDALSRLETMVAMANLNLPEKAIRQQVASAIQVVIQVGRLSDGTRTGYGLGWEMANVGRRRAFMKGGEISGFHHYLLSMPDVPQLGSVIRSELTRSR